MCLPIALLKCLVKFNSFITLLVGIGALTAAIIVQVKSGGFYLENINSDSNGDSIVECLFIFGAITFVLGITGWIAGYKKKMLLLAIYNFGNCLLAVTFLALALTSLLYSDKFADLDQSKDEKIIIFR